MTGLQGPKGNRLQDYQVQQINRSQINRSADQQITVQQINRSTDSQITDTRIASQQRSRCLREHGNKAHQNAGDQETEGLRSKWAEGSAECAERFNNHN